MRHINMLLVKNLVLCDKSIFYKTFFDNTIVMEKTLTRKAGYIATSHTY